MPVALPFSAALFDSTFWAALFLGLTVINPTFPASHRNHVTGFLKNA
ncbi:hypothetical protein RAM19_07925 [Bartonella apihabitans]|nr:hypothetical protein [Bartonella apihabitans]WLT08025.1 hypothetical protein RAM19_07925 [Bartonella apihabitans]